MLNERNNIRKITLKYRETNLPSIMRNVAKLGNKYKKALIYDKEM
jgi:hypothetical protein